mmetsp:Transcript_28221/g.89720  ORF Transcript_28221/g.89720 Transcript_28221/m.89720 type:complete len:389 (-) Transcript_28221:456-1622(-)
MGRPGRPPRQGVALPLPGRRAAAAAGLVAAAGPPAVLQGGGLAGVLAAVEELVVLATVGRLLPLRAGGPAGGVAATRGLPQLGRGDGPPATFGRPRGQRFRRHLPGARLRRPPRRLERRRAPPRRRRLQQVRSPRRELLLRRDGGPACTRPGIACMRRQVFVRLHFLHFLHFLGRGSRNALAQSSGVLAAQPIGHHEAQVAMYLPIEFKLGWALRWLRQQGAQAPVPVLLHLVQRQVVLAVAVWHFELQRYVVHAPEEEDDRERGARSQVLPQHQTAEHGAHEPVDDEHDHARLCIGKREGELGDLPGVLQVHDAARELLEDPGDHGRRDVQDARLHVEHGGPLDPLDDDLDLVRRLLQELETLWRNAVAPDDLETLALLLGRHLLEC